ncbi:glycoside hydrolase family 73 protein [Clostridium thailandense]|uniref:glycoside hydrolase family 73 protein n=1 Tax=Clostridium thailandense TaxID=2794346 RepID=UPI00398915F5
MSRKNNNRFKNMVMVVITLTFAALIGLGIYAHYTAKYKHINLKELNTKLYIEAADNVSKEKLQTNWQYMAAIDGVRYKNDFSKATSSNVNQLANMFLEKNTTSVKVKNSEYKLVDLDEVLNKLSFDSKQQAKVHSYIEDLKYTGTLKNNLNDSAKQKFIQELYPGAVQIYEKYNVLPSIIISQAILESGWGKSDLSVKANNLFGIKADSNWKGKKVKMNTSEYYDKKIVDNFRVYDNKEQSLKDYGEFLKNNKRYKQNGVFQATQYIAQANAIEKAGYSTVENKNGEQIYSELLIGIIKDQNLQLLDYQCEMRYLKGNK